MESSSHRNGELLRDVASLQERVSEPETPQKKHGQANMPLSRNGAIFEAIFQTFPDLFFHLDAEGTILDYQAGHTSSLYLPPEAFLNRRMQDVLPPGAGQLFHQAIHLVLETQALKSIEYELPMPGGKRSYEARLLPLSKKQIIVVVRDISDRKNAEREIQALNEDLKRRTLELENANKELEAFCFSVAHDLRTPLLLIGGFSRMLSERYSTHFDAKGRHVLEVIHTNTQQMWQLLEDLLTLSRLQFQEMKSSEIDMSHLARSVSEELRFLSPERALQFHLHPLPPAHGDTALIRQVFVNLLSNAIKFTRTKETSTIEIGCLSREHRQVYYVKDNGVGFDMGEAEKLYGVFQRLHTVEKFEGLGVGLAIVQRIVQRHGGSVWAEGKVNEGATFYFTLPGTEPETGKEGL